MCSSDLGLHAHIISCDFDKDNNAKTCIVLHAEMACGQGYACMKVQVRDALLLGFSYCIIAPFQGIEVSK